MTVGQKVQQTLAQCESVAANLKSFALDTQDKQSQQMYAQLAQALENQVIAPLRSRVGHVETQEPSYKIAQPQNKQVPKH